MKIRDPKGVVHRLSKSESPQITKTACGMFFFKASCIVALSDAKVGCRNCE